MIIQGNNLIVNGTSVDGTKLTNHDKITINSSGNVGIGTSTPAVSLDLSARTDVIALPRGTTAQRPTAPLVGMLRFNTSIDALEYYTTVSSWSKVGTFSPRDYTGLVGWYTATSYNSGTWTDLSGNGNNATSTRGTINKASHNGATYGASATFDVLYGNTSAGIQFPSAILPSTFTLYHVARYNLDIGVTGGNEVGRGRIFDGVARNWLSGFHGGGSGKFYHEGWISPETDRHGNYWMISSDSNSNNYDSNGGSYVRSRSKNANGGVVYINTGGGNATRQLSVNYGEYTGAVQSSETSNWMVAEVIVYNRAMTAAETAAIESYLSFKYGV